MANHSPLLLPGDTLVTPLLAFGSLFWIRESSKRLPGETCKGQKESSIAFQRLTLSEELQL